MEDIKDAINRRTVLKSCTTALLAVGGSTIVSADEGEYETKAGTLDLSFDPTDEKELGEFVVTFDAVEDHEKDRIWEELDDEQRGGVVFGLSPQYAEQTIVKHSDEGTIGPNRIIAPCCGGGGSGGDTYKFTTRTEAKSWYGTTPYTLVHRVYWDVSSDTVRNMSQKGLAEDVAWGYVWNGTTGSSYTESRGSFGDSYVQGHFVWDGGADFSCPLPYIDNCSPKASLYPSSLVEVDDTGSGEVVQSDADDNIF